MLPGSFADGVQDPDRGKYRSPFKSLVQCNCESAFNKGDSTVLREYFSPRSGLATNARQRGNKQNLPVGADGGRCVAN
jgi:hypothetical protein